MINRKATVFLIISLLALVLLAGCNKAPGKDQATGRHLPASTGQQVSGPGEAARTGNEGPAANIPQPATGESKLQLTAESNPVKAGAEAKTTDQAPVDNTKAAGKEANAAKPRVRLVGTRDFGQTLLSGCWVPLDKTVSALDVTTANLQTKTAYGGVFITSINGLASGYTGKVAWDKKKEDWFLYYNGKIAATGANSIVVKDGDIIWWDYHDWGGEQKPMPAVPPSK